MADMLVTGGAGFIGSNFVRHWATVHPQDRLLVLDSLTYAGNPTNLAGVEQAELVVGDIRDDELVTRLLVERGIDTIVHFAAESHVDRSIEGPDTFVETNIVGTHSLLKAARRAWIDRGTGRPHRFHQVSTDEVYGALGPHDPAFREDMPYAPNSPYAASKASADMIVRAYAHTYDLQVTISNCSNNYGPYQYPEKLIPLLLINALLGRPLPVYGDGSNVRDWLHVIDHCIGISACLTDGVAGETYNFGGNSERTNLAVARQICGLIDRAFDESEKLARRFPGAPAANGENTEGLVSLVTDRAGHDFRYAIDNSKAERDLSFHPAIDFEEGLSRTLNWYLENEDWWRPLLTS